MRVQLNDAGGAIGLDAAGQLQASARFDPADAAVVKAALLGKPIEPPPVLRQLVSPPAQLLGGRVQSPAQSSTQIPDMAPLAPLGTVVVSDRPSFRWRTVPGANGYVVSIYAPGFRKVAESPRLAQDHWDADRPLGRDVTYTWQIRAEVDGTAIRAPIPPAPEARFHVLSQGEAARLNAAKRAHADSHLLLGILYTRAGALDDAERELGTLTATNPDSEVARDLLTGVRRLRRGD
jgi:hypothetical protein